MLLNGLVIMAVGMGAVFLFLIIMVISMNITSVVLAKISKYIPEKEETTKKLEKVHEKNDEIAVVIAAVKAYCA
ncbi:MAG: OadG family protein [Candidatus Gastranaerophilales bacterium]|nr:OadG family protein [Candidatus Gastranaerophilales bacterium]